MRTIYKISILFTILCSFFQVCLFAQNNDLTLGGGAGELNIQYLASGRLQIYRNNVKQLYSSSGEPFFAIKIGSSVYSSNSTTLLTIDGDLSVDKGLVQERTKVFSGLYNSLYNFSVTVKFVYNKSNPNYVTVEALIDASNIPAGTIISYGYGFDTYVNGCDAASAYIVPDINEYNGVLNANRQFSTDFVRSLRMVGAKNTWGTGTLIGLFPMGRMFDRAYSSVWSGYTISGMVSSTNGNRFSFSPYNYSGFSCDTGGSGIDPWDNAIGGLYDNIPAGTKTTIRTGLTFTDDLDGELDYTWNGSKDYVANLGENIDLNLKYTSYNPNEISGVGFKVDLPGLKIRSAGSQSGFISGVFDCTVGNEYYKLTNGRISGYNVADIVVPVQITQCGKWEIGGNAISDASRALPLGAIATLIVQSTANLTSTAPVNMCSGGSTTMTVKFPDGVTPAQDAIINLNYAGATASFSSMPATVTIPANQNSATFTVVASPTAADNASLTVTLSSAADGFINIGTDQSIDLKVNPRGLATNIDIDNKTICANSAATLSVNSPYAGAIYNWYATDTESGTLLHTGTSYTTPVLGNATTTVATKTYYVSIQKTDVYCENLAASRKPVTVSINPIVTVNYIPAIIACNNSYVSPITLTSPNTGATFEWKNNDPAILDLPTTGTLSTIPTFAVKNETSIPVIATITVTPYYSFNNIKCQGISQDIQITVNPTTTVNPISDIFACKGSLVDNILLISPTTGATFVWTNDTPSIGLPSNGTASGLNPSIPQFTALNSTSAPVIATIKVTPYYNSCEGTSSTFTITVYPEVKAGTISGNPDVCVNVKPLPIKGTESTGGSGSYNYQWEKSENNTTWVPCDGMSTGKDYAPEIINVNTYFRRKTTDQCTVLLYSNTFMIRVISEPVVMYWKPTGTDNNWNNPANWANKEGVALNSLPLSCTDVHISGGLTKYPSLDTTNSPDDLYGVPTAKDITFHYGGQVAYPHKLDYQRAYIQYNWGYYDGQTTAQPAKNYDGNTSFITRDNWYMLSAPLKNMVSGDFSLAGYPMTWQAVYNMTNPVTGGFDGVDLSKPFAANNIDLKENYNAIAIKVAPYNSTLVGYKNHRDLEGLKGILEIPYFENEAVARYHSGHQYDKFTQISSLFYYNNKTLQQLNNPIGTVDRGTRNQSYRFIYEDAENLTPDITVDGVDGIKTVKGYSQTVTTASNTRKVLIGNPFMSAINSQRFLDANSANLDAAEGYQVSSGTSQIWLHNSFSSSHNIAPLEAFVVTLAENKTTAELLFPLEDDKYGLTGANFMNNAALMPQGTSLYVRAGASGNTTNSDYAVLNTESATNIKKMVLLEGHITPEAFFVLPQGTDYNLVQAYDDDIRELKLGIRSSITDQPLTLTFDNILEFARAKNVRPVLVDKYLNVEQDLTQNNEYSLIQRQVKSGTQYADADRFVLRLQPSEGIIATDGLIITYIQNQLKITSAQSLKEVRMYTLIGQQVHQSRTLEASIYNYEHTIPLTHGVYIVKVTHADGKVVTRKIIAL